VAADLVLNATKAPLPHVQKLVLIILAGFAAADGTRCFPGEETLTQECGLAATGVRRATRWLEDAGWLARVRVGRRMEYLLDAPRLRALRRLTASAPLADTERSASGSCQGSSQYPSERATGSAPLAVGPTGSAVRPMPARPSTDSSADASPTQSLGWRPARRQDGPQRVGAELPESVRVAHALQVLREVPGTGTGEAARLCRVSVAAIEAAMVAQRDEVLSAGGRVHR
jgi:hypothetical protein